MRCLSSFAQRYTDLFVCKYENRYVYCTPTSIEREYNVIVIDILVELTYEKELVAAHS